MKAGLNKFIRRPRLVIRSGRAGLSLPWSKRGQAWAWGNVRLGRGNVRFSTRLTPPRRGRR